MGLTSIYEFVLDSVNNIREFILFKNELKIFICAHVRNVDELVTRDCLAKSIRKLILC